MSKQILLKSHKGKTKKMLSPRLYMSSLLFLIFSGITQTAMADGCENKGSRPYNINMLANPGDIKLSGNVSKYQEIGRYTFTKDANEATDYVAECRSGATVYAVAGGGELAAPTAQFFENIDGQPTFYILNSFNAGQYEYAYALIDNETNRPFGNRDYYSELQVNDDKMRPRSATVILYAAVDNPTKTLYLNRSIGLGGLLPHIPSNQVGITYKFDSGKIEAAPNGCNLENPDNLSITLPRSPISAFNDVGDTHSRESTDLSITCTSNMTAKISLRLDSSQVERDDYGQETVIKNEKETGEFAKGIGFVLSIDGTRLIDDEWVNLSNLGNGTTHIPIDAEYYRYGYTTSAGKVQAIANFVVEFN